MWQIVIVFAIFQTVLFRTLYSSSNLALNAKLNWNRVVFIKRSNIFLAKIECFLKFHAFLKKKEAEENFSDNPSQITWDYFTFWNSFRSPQRKIAKVLSPKAECTSCLTTCQMI